MDDLAIDTEASIEFSSRVDTGERRKIDRIRESGDAGNGDLAVGIDAEIVGLVGRVAAIDIERDGSTMCAKRRKILWLTERVLAAEVEILVGAPKADGAYDHDIAIGIETCALGLGGCARRKLRSINAK